MWGLPEVTVQEISTCSSLGSSMGLQGTIYSGAVSSLGCRHLLRHLEHLFPLLLQLWCLHSCFSFFSLPHSVWHFFSLSVNTFFFQGTTILAERLSCVLHVISWSQLESAVPTWLLSQRPPAMTPPLPTPLHGHPVLIRCCFWVPNGLYFRLFYLGWKFHWVWWFSHHYRLTAIRTHKTKKLKFHIDWVFSNLQGWRENGMAFIVCFKYSQYRLSEYRLDFIQSDCIMT